METRMVGWMMGGRERPKLGRALVQTPRAFVHGIPGICYAVPVAVLSDETHRGADAEDAGHRRVCTRRRSLTEGDVRVGVGSRAVCPCRGSVHGSSHHTPVPYPLSLGYERAAGAAGEDERRAALALRRNRESPPRSPAGRYRTASHPSHGPRSRVGPGSRVGV